MRGRPRVALTRPAVAENIDPRAENIDAENIDPRVRGWAPRVRPPYCSSQRLRARSRQSLRRDKKSSTVHVISEPLQEPSACAMPADRSARRGRGTHIAFLSRCARMVVTWSLRALAVCLCTIGWQRNYLSGWDTRSKVCQPSRGVREIPPLRAQCLLPERRERSRA